MPGRQSTGRNLWTTSVANGSEEATGMVQLQESEEAPVGKNIDITTTRPGEVCICGRVEKREGEINVQKQRRATGACRRRRRRRENDNGGQERVFYSDSLPELSEPELESDECSLSLVLRTGAETEAPPPSKRAMRSSSCRIFSASFSSSILFRLRPPVPVPLPVRFRLGWAG